MTSINDTDNISNINNKSVLNTDSIIKTLSSTTSSANLTFTKTSSPPYVKTGDIITYTLAMTNIGDLVAKDIVATDEVPPNTTFISNSFSGDGVNLGINNELIIYIDNLLPGAGATVTFDTLLTSMPSTGEVHNSAMVGYMYTIDSLSQNETVNTVSNIATNTVNEAIIDNSVNGAFNLAVSPNFGDIGDTLTYTLSINNTGNVDATNVVITCTIPDNLNFVVDSVYVDSVANPGATPMPGNGIAIANLNVGTTSTIVFNVQIATIPSINVISNIAKATFNYTLDPSLPNEAVGYGYSNESIIEVNKAIIDYDNGNGRFNLSAKKYSTVGDTITYNYILGNTGNVPANNIIFTSITENELTFEENSVYINGNSITGENPNLGVAVGSILPGDVLTLSFNTIVNTVPSDYIISNNATVNFEYTKNPQVTNGQSATGTSEIFTTEINLAIIEDNDFIISCDKNYAGIGETLTYELSVKNTGNIEATNVSLINNIQQEVSYISNSLYINNVNAANLNSINNITLGTIPSGEIFTVNYKLLVNTIPSTGFISTNAALTYNYTFDPSIPNLGVGESYSNTAKTKINSAIVDNSSEFNLYASGYNKVGDTITYTFSIKNTGNIAATDIILFDTIPFETSFIENSLNINGVSVPNSINNNGIYIGTIDFDTLATVNFKVVVNSIPSINPIKNSGFISYKYIVNPIEPTIAIGTGISNIAITTINQGKIQLNNYVDKVYSNTKDPLTHSYIFENIGNTVVNNILFICTLPNEANYIQNSLALNGVSIPDSSISLSSGVSLNNLNEGEIATLNFSVNATTIPSTGILKNNGLALYDFIVSPEGSGIIVDDYTLSNEVGVIINEAIIDYTQAGFNKFTSAEYLGYGDVLTYTCSLQNTGNVTAYDVVFTDTLSTGEIFISNSVKIDGISKLGENTSNGIALGNVLPNSIVSLQYAVIIDTIPTLNTISSGAAVTFNYKINPNSDYLSYGFGYSNSPVVTIKKAIIDYDDGNGEFITSYYDKYTNLGKEITFEFTLGNTGNTQADKVILYNTLMDGLSFVPNSIYINSINIPGSTPEIGINIGTIPPLLLTGVKSKVKFNAIVNTIPSLNAFKNKATVTYAYNQGLDSSTEKISEGSSDEVTIIFNTVNLDNNKGGLFTQNVNKSYAKKGDVLTYTIAMKNTGNVSANNVIFINTIPDGTNFIENSLNLNGATLPGENPAPPSGINIGTLGADILNTISFDVSVYTIPSSEKIQNSSTLVYSYIYDPSLPDVITSSAESDVVKTFVRCPIINKNEFFTLDVPSKAGNEISYSFVMQNKGNVAANNTIFKGIIPSELTFIQNSLEVNNLPNLSENPLDNNGVNLGILNPLDIATINFNVKVYNLPSTNPITSYGRVDYSFTANPSIPNGESSFGESEVKETDIKLAIINNENNEGIIKSVDKKYVKRGDTLVYTITLKNTGNVTAKDVILKDSIPYNTTFIDNSILVNGLSSVNEGTLPNLQLSLGNIDAGVTFSVVFSIALDTIVNVTPILNSLNLIFDYALDNNTIVTASTKSNVVETQSLNVILDNTAYVDFNYDVDVNNNISSSGKSNMVESYYREAIIDNSVNENFKATVNKNKAKLGDTLTYTIVLKNSGNITANNVIFTDSISKEVNFLENSLLVNGITLASGYNPIYPKDINIGDINSNETFTINYSVVVDTLPTLGFIESNSSIKYSYILNPISQEEVLASSSGDKLITKVNEAIIDNKNGLGEFNTVFYNAYTTLGKEINYKFTLANTGNTIAKNVIFTNTLPYGIEYVSNSIKVNSQSIFGGTPYGGINIGSVEPLSLGGNHNSIEFKAKVMSIPDINPISNKAQVTFTYNDDTNILNEVTGTGASDNVNTIFNVAYINNENFNIFCNKAYGDIKDTLDYILTMKNIGNVNATEVVLVTTIPKDVSIINDSLYINNINESFTNSNNIITLNLGTIPSEQVFTINFKTVVNTIPSSNFIDVSAWSSYLYEFNPISQGTERGEGLSNLARTKINKAIIDKSGLFTLSTSSYNKLKDVITYNFDLRNTGNAPAVNVIFKNTIPNETSFVANSVFINGITVPNGNPTSINGLNLGTINAGNSVNIKFNVVVDSIPNINPIENFATVDFSYIVDEANTIPKFSSGISNTSTTTINQGLLLLNNNVDRKYASTNDTLTYTIVMQNKGNTAINNVIFTDSIPVESSFIENSLYVNLSTIPLENPSLENGISIGTMESSDIVTLNFKVAINTLPNVNPIKNISNAKFDFTLSSDNEPVIINDVVSKVSETMVNEAIIDNSRGHGFIKYADKTFVGFGDEVVYTHVIKNTGNVTAEDVVFYDSIPAGSSFIANSLLLNGVTIANKNPEEGVDISNIATNIENILIYKVKINSLSSFILMENKANVVFKYTVDPSIPKGYSGFGQSNTLKINVIKAIIDYDNGNGEFTGPTGEIIANIGKKIDISYALKNTGNVIASNVVFSSTIPNGLKFIDNTFNINGVIQNDANPQSGIDLGELEAYSINSDEIIIEYKLFVASIPNNNPINSTANVTFNYTQVPDDINGAVGSGSSNECSFNVIGAIINNTDNGFVQNISKNYAEINDSLTYNMIITNTGNTAANNVVFKDTLPNGLNLNPTILIINGFASQASRESLINGIQLGTILPGATKTLMFSVIITPSFTENPMVNEGTVIFDYIADPNLSKVETVYGTSNKVSTKLVYTPSNPAAYLHIVDKSYGFIGDTLTYNTIITNSGNTSMNNVLVTTAIPQGASFISKSLVVNNVTLPLLSPDNPNGINLGDINEGNISTVSFKVTVTTVPSSNWLNTKSFINYSYRVDPSIPNNITKNITSNETSVRVVDSIIDNDKAKNFKVTASTDSVIIGDTITYLIEISNNGNLNVNNAFLKDTIPTGTEFIANSLYLNGSNVNSGSISEGDGLNIGDINSYSMSTLSFKVVVNTLPSNYKIVNNASIKYTINIDTIPEVTIITGGNSNETTTLFKKAVIDNKDGIFTITPDKYFATIDDEVLYTITLKNTGTADANNIILTSTIPVGTEFIKDSLIVNGRKILKGNPAPPTGVNIGSLLFGGTTTVAYKVKVTNLVFTNNITEIINSANVSFNYTIDKLYPNNTKGYGTSNVVSTKTVYSVITGDSFTNIADKNYCIVGDIINYSLKLTNKGNADISNIILTNTLPEGLSFVEDSLYIDDELQDGVNIEDGIILQYLDTGASISANFKAVVSAVPDKNATKNIASVIYDYEVDPIIKRIFTKTSLSQVCVVTINQAVINYKNKAGFILNTDEIYVSEGDKVSYTASLKNTGNVEANMVTLVNKIPEGTTYVDNSLNINGDYSNNNPYIINLQNLSPGALSTVVFKVTVNTTPDPNTILNTSEVSFKYTCDPSLPLDKLSNGASNENIVIVNTAGFPLEKDGFTLNSNKDYATINDVINYEAVLKNIGNTTVVNGLFIDELPYGIEFIQGSVFINGTSDTIANPKLDKGISLSNIAANEVVIIDYKGLVMTLPRENPVSNNAVINYSYILDPSNENGRKGQDVSNSIFTSISSPFISNADGGFVITTDKEYLRIGDTLTYTVSIKNTGNINAEEVIYYNTIPEVTSVIPNSIYVNEVQKDGSLTDGINIGYLGSSAVSTLNFSIILNSYPEGNILENSGYISYRYLLPVNTPNSYEPNTLINQEDNLITPSSNTISYLANTIPSNILYSNSNVISILMVNPKVDINITADKSIIDVGNTLTYTVTVRNTGNVFAEDIIITNTIPSATSYIDKSLTINGIARTDIDLNKPFNIGNLDIQDSISFSFKIIANSIPHENILDYVVSASFDYTLNTGNVVESAVETNNYTGVSINTANLNIIHGADKIYVTDGDIVNYSIKIENNGNISAYNITVTANIPKEVKYIQESLKINLNESSSSLLNGLIIDSIPPGAVVVISYQVKILDNTTFKDIGSYIDVSYSYENSDINIVTTNKESNKVFLNYRQAEIVLKKYQDKKLVVLNEDICYSLIIKNTGNITAQNVLVKDNLPACFEFIRGSLCINNVKQATFNIAQGIVIKKLDSYSEITITFMAKAIKVPFSNIAYNVVSAKYIYKLTDNHSEVSKYVEEGNNDIIVIAPICSTKKITNYESKNPSNNYSLRNNFYSIKGLPNKEDYLSVGEFIRDQYMWSKNEVNAQINLGPSIIRKIESINGEIELIRTEIVESPYTGPNTNLDNKKLTGNKMIINAMIKYSIKYVDNNGEIKIQRAHKLFGVYIAINPKYALDSLKVDYCLEDITIVKLCDNIAHISSKVLFYLLPESYKKILNSVYNNSVIGISNSKLVKDVKNFIGPNDSYWEDFNIYVTDNLGINFHQIVSAKAKVKILYHEVISKSNYEKSTKPTNKLLINMSVEITVGYIEKSKYNIVQNLKGEIPFSTTITIDSDSNHDDLFKISACIENIYVGMDNQSLFTNTTVVIKANKVSQ